MGGEGGHGPLCESIEGRGKRPENRMGWWRERRGGEKEESSGERVRGRDRGKAGEMLGKRKGGRRSGRAGARAMQEGRGERREGQSKEGGGVGGRDCSEGKGGMNRKRVRATRG